MIQNEPGNEHAGAERAAVPGCILRVASVRASGGGYPNAEQTIRLLQANGVASIRHLGSALPPGLHLWRLGQSGPLRQCWLLTRLVLSNARSLVRVLLDHPNRNAAVYVPYPALFFLWLVSLVPRRLRPVCIADAYISIWDSLFNDRGRGGQTTLAGVVRAIESRALRAASLVLVDTEANREFYIEQFGLPPERVRSVPLAIDAAPFIARRNRTPSGERIRVLFVGTMIPLHGIDKILEAARLLAHRDDIEFRLVGDGQMGDEVQRRIAAGLAPNVSWLRDWIPLDAVADEIANAHICLGVFGGGAKAARVLPFKLYYALAGGRAIITQRPLSTPEGVPAPPVVSISDPDPALLARTIARLALDPDERVRLGAQARAYYDQWLSAPMLAARWQQILIDMA